MTATEPDAAVKLAQLRRTRRAQGGALTRAQALAAGHTPAQIRTLLRRHAWVDLERGIYVEGSRLAAAGPHEEHALRVAARVLALGGGHAASRRSASLVLGLPLLGAIPSPPEVVRARRAEGDRPSTPSVRVAALPEDHLVHWRDVDCTAPARLVCDIARTHGQVEALMVADASLRAGLDRTQLQAVAEHCARWSGASRIAAVLAAAEPRTDSPLESLTRWVLRQLGLPEPLSQVDVLHRGQFLGRVDFAWPELGVVLEADGMGKYREGTLADEKRRELGLRRAGVEVVRSSWDDAWHRPQQIADLWHEHVALAATRPGLRRETRFELSWLEPTGSRGIPFPSKAATPLPGPV